MEAAINKKIPACPNCRTPFGLELYNRGGMAPCPTCRTQLRVEIFPAAFRQVRVAALAGDAVMVHGESTCYYHDGKRAAVVCDGCGRFLCSLCDCAIHGQHLCPPCLESGQRKGALTQLETSRVDHGHQALLFSLVPLFLTGLIAIYVVLRHWKSPGSLVKRRSWQKPVALTFGILQTLGFAVLIYGIIKS